MNRSGTVAGADVTPDASPDASSARHALRALALAGGLLVVVIVVASAYLRLSAAGLSCSDWPACYGRIVAASETSAWERVARIAHRIAATAVAAIALALPVLAWVARPRRAATVTLASGVFIVVVALAILGIATPKLNAAGPLLPAVTLANLLGGFVLLALVAGVHASTRPPIAVSKRVGILAFVALGAIAAQVVLGGFVSARFAGLACPTFPLCGVEVSAASLPALLDPFAPLVVDATNTVVRTPELASLQWAHRVGAHLVLFAAIALAIAFVRARLRALAAFVLAPVIVELALGASSAILRLPLPVVLAHNLVAALLLATLVHVAVRLAHAAN
ncbi:MAG TPA: COX15/CtaA family protein [Casimicrobiaceae bacterium]|nr:COX15/CtaA family protein [Casimicrobiaceae bacterium]